MRGKSWLVEYTFVFVVICIASALVILNATHNSYTVDEPNHIAAGLELLDMGTYTVEFQHPPIARVAAALLPWLYGYKFFPGEDSWGAGRNTLYQGDPGDLVSKARFGVLPFLWLLLIYVYLWAKKIGGRHAGSLAVLLVASCPVVLAHAGLATLDLAASAFILAALYYFYVFLDRENLSSLLLFSLFNTLAICTKFSAIPFLGISYVVTFIFFALSPGTTLSSFKHFFRLRYIVLLFFVSFFVSWASYGFSLISLAQNVPEFSKKFALGSEKFHFVRENRELILFICNLRLPSFLVSIPSGIIHLSYHNSVGHSSYLLGEVRDNGWWYFYFVAFFYKTPIVFLGLGVGAIILWTYKYVLSFKVSALDVPFISIGAIFLFASIFSNINIGIRHLLIIYPLAAVAIATFFSGGTVIAISKKYLLAIYVLIVAFTIALPFKDMGEYLSYFNYFAGNRPEKILINSDYEWGQDYNRLAEEVSKKNINNIFLAMPFAGATDFNKLLGVNFTMVKEGTAVSGWVAVSEYWQAVRGVDLEKCISVNSYIGKTIKLYYLSVPVDVSSCKKN